MTLASLPSKRLSHGPYKAEQVNRSFLRGAKSVPLFVGSNMPAKIKAMLVMVRERRLSLLDALESCGIEVLAVSDCNEVRRMLKSQPPVHVVITDTVLPDGDWRRVLEIMAESGPNIEVIVHSRLGDPKLWLDVLEQGGYDVLVEPYHHEEIKRIVEAAAARSYMRSHAQSISHKRKAVRAALAGMRS